VLLAFLDFAGRQMAVSAISRCYTRPQDTWRKFRADSMPNRNHWPARTEQNVQRCLCRASEICRGAQEPCRRETLWFTV